MKQKVIQALETAAQQLGYSESVELTPSRGRSDFATNLAMKLAKKINANPLDVAQQIIANLSASFIARAEVAKPGFINLYLNPNSLALQIQQVLDEGPNYGRGQQSKYVNVEYVSVNPTGYLHVGHARNAALGATLSSVLKFAGNRVDQEYYVNNVGVQMKVLAESLYVRYLQALSKSAELPEEAYRGPEIIHLAEQIVQSSGEKYLKLPANQVKEEFAKIAENFMIEKIKQHLELIGVKMDRYYYEQDLYDQKLVIPALESMPDTYRQGGALWLRTTKFGDDKDRVLIKSDGSFTYFASDIAYHSVKLKRGYDELIDVWGGDHIGYVKRVKISLNQLGLASDKLDIIIIQMVRLIQGGQELKMSKRKGVAFTLEELVKTIGRDAARFYLISRANTTQVDINLDLVTSANSDNLVYMVQYSHARARQLLVKGNCPPQVGAYLEGKENQLINLISEFPELIVTIADNHKVHLLPQYLVALARLFNQFYSETRIINSERESELLALVKAVKQVLATGLALIGVNAPDQM
ncbi:uncharacterized protein LOC111615385 [Centruroides sculpturatus]|uniref:uncharacterized protein LOC111615385 n=1 Tax=Centruroides sculpturatus TaxID=218467 RepID=UPI000C6E02C1|nr:uncharacterized protein LOC111615385 [Centruroides sculpturatus]